MSTVTRFPFITKVINTRDSAAVKVARADGSYVYIGRESGWMGTWGNRYTHLHSTVHGTIRVATREEAIRRHREETLGDPELCNRIRVELKGKTLACYCSPLSCHGDTLALIADGILVERIV